MRGLYETWLRIDFKVIANGGIKHSKRLMDATITFIPTLTLIVLQLEGLGGDAFLPDHLDLDAVSGVDVSLRNRHKHILHDRHRLLYR